MINHAQLLSLTSSFSLKWSSIVEDILSTSRPVAEISTQILSFDWFFNQRSNHRNNIMRLYYQKMIVYVVLPIIMALIWTVFWSLYFWRKDKSEIDSKKIRRIIASFIIMFFLVYSTIVQYMFSNFE